MNGLRWTLMAALGAVAAAAPPINNGPSVARSAGQKFALNKQLMSLSIEFDSTVKFFGDVGEPNGFSYQLLQNVVDRAGTPPVLRIGANTQDRASFCPDCNDTLTTISNTDPNDPKQSEALYVTFNAGLFDVITENVPRGSPIIFGLNFRNNSLALAESEAAAAAKYLDHDIVMAYELGNEPNLYGDYRPEGYDAQDYARQMRRWLPSIKDALYASAKFMFGSFAGPPTYFDDDLKLANLIRMGVPQSISGVKYYSTHGYPYDICSNESAALVNLTNFLDHEKTVALINDYSNETAAVKSVGGVLHMGETGTVACHGKANVSNTLGAALFEIDYAFQGALAGYARFFYHNGQGDYYYSMWEPQGTELHPGHHIYPTYYSMLFVADVVGDLQRPEIASLADHDTSSAVHYAIYEGGEDGCARKLVLLNTEFYDGVGERPSREFSVANLLGSEHVCFRRLTGEKSAATDGVTWGGQSVENAGGTIVGELQREAVTDGRVVLRASEGALVEACD